MRKFLLALAFLLAPTVAFAQCNGVFPANTFCGNASGSPNVPTAVLTSTIPLGLTVGSTTVGSGTTLRVLYDNAGVLGEYTNTQLTALINSASATLSGALPAWPNTTSTFFRGDGTYQTLNCAALASVGTGCAAAAGITALTTDVTASGSGSVAATLATVNSNVGSFGSTTAIPSFTVNGKGLITAASGNVVIAPAGTLSGGTLAAGVLASSLTSTGTLTGGATGAGFTVALGTSTVTGVLGLTNGGTNQALTASNGGIVYSDASKLNILAGTVTAAQCLLSGSNTAPTWGSCSGAAAVSAVANSDGSLTISPTTGSVVASLAPGHANTWTAVQTFTNSDVRLLGSSTGYTTFTSDNASGTNYTLHVPAGDDTVDTIAATQTLSNKTLASPVLTGVVSGAGTIPSSVLANSGVSAASYTNTSLTVNAQGQITAASNGTASSLSSKVKQFTYAMSTATGTQAITGIGFVPTSCSISWGFATGTLSLRGNGYTDSTKSGVAGLTGLDVNTGNGAALNGTVAIFVASDVAGAAANNAKATISSYDSDGFTLSWVKTGTPTGTVTINAICYK